MRGFSLPIKAAILTALTGLGGLFLWQRFPIPSADIVSAIARQRAEFLERNPKTRFQIDIGTLRQSLAGPELSDPSQTLPQTHRFPRDEITSLTEYATRCPKQSPSTKKFQSFELKKAFQWHRFLCGMTPELPPNFFSISPYLHPSGISYARMALDSKRSEFAGADWLAQNRRYLHLVELIELETPVSPALRLRPGELQGLIHGDPLVLSQDFVFLLRAAPNTKSFLTNEVYGAYPRSDWDSFNRSTEFLPSPNVSQPTCAVTEGRVCWQINPHQQKSNRNTLTLFFIVCLFTLSAVLGVDHLQQRKRRRLELKQRVFALQLLTHELRTPATALKLAIESLRQDYDQLPSSAQRTFLSICEDVQRLQRMIDLSRNYLASENPSSTPIDNRSFFINDFILTLLEHHPPDSIRFQGLPIDRKVQGNPFWLELCIRNLVVNALSHGVSPITIACRIENRHLVISVQDQGSLPVGSLENLARPFYRGEKSQGLGLGLTIVRRAVQFIDGDLEFSSEPTTFRLRLPMPSGGEVS